MAAVTDEVPANPWPELPGPKWQTVLQARTWLIDQRRLLDWSHKDVERAFSDCAWMSDLYIGPGGGPLFDRATEKRVARLERDGKQIPDWLYWIPLAIQLAQVPFEDRWDWARAHIPANSEVRKEREEQEYESRLYELDDAEIALIERFRTMTGTERGVLSVMAEPATIRWWVDTLKRAGERKTDLFDVIAKALS